MTSRSLKLQGCSLGFGAPLPDDLRDRWSRGVVVEADDQGHFRLPIETDPSAFVVAVHDFGTCQIAFHELERLNELRLHQWGRVEGTVFIGKDPSAGEKVTAYDVPWDTSAYPWPFTYFYELRTDAAGRFVIEHFPPGTGGMALPDYTPTYDKTGPWSYVPPIPEGAIGRFHVRAGETTVVTLGGEGLGPRRGSGEDDGDEGDGD